MEKEKNEKINGKLIILNVYIYQISKKSLLILKSLKLDIYNI